MTYEDLASLKAGDVLECPGLFPGMDKEPILWTRTRSRVKLEFDLSWCGADLGRVQVCVEDDGALKGKQA